MSEKMIEEMGLKTADASKRVVETALKKAWSILDAATERKTPSEILSPKGIQAIQGIGEA